METNWNDKVLGGKKELDDFIKELKSEQNRHSIVKLLRIQTKSFLLVLAEYLTFPAKPKHKKAFLVTKIANIITR